MTSPVTPLKLSQGNVTRFYIGQVYSLRGKLGHDRLDHIEELPIATAASVIGVPRSTAKSWLQQDMLMLTSDKTPCHFANLYQNNHTETLQCQ